MTAKIDKRPARVNYKYRRGDTVAEQVTIEEGGVAANITGRTYRAQLRKTVGGEVFVAFTVDITNPAGGVLVMRLTDTQTEPLSGRYYWDLEQTAGGVVRTLMAGEWTFDPDVTRDSV